ncbi:MAG: hypothetical protein ACRDU8_00625 [Egibacteraceae bacterium]
MTWEHGNELLQRFNPAYDKGQTREAVGYALPAVWEVLGGYGPPPHADAQIATARDAFAGYLMFDALIANTDRHHENWAVVQPRSGAGWLSPSFDHATSFGFQEPEDRKAAFLREPGAMVAWVERGRSSHFEEKPTLLALARQGMQRSRAGAQQHWRDRLEFLTEEEWETTIVRIPAELMSQADRTFASEIIGLNRDRLLDACWPD